MTAIRCSPLQPCSSPRQINPVLRCPSRKLGPPNLVSLQTNRVKTTTNQGSWTIQASLFPLPTLFSVESGLFLRLATPFGPRQPPSADGPVNGGRSRTWSWCFGGPSCFVTHSEANRLKKKLVEDLKGVPVGPVKRMTRVDGIPGAHEDLTEGRQGTSLSDLLG